MVTRIVQVSPTDPVLHQLIERLDEDLARRYPPEEIFKVDFQNPDVLQMVFTVAYREGVPAGCGALKPAGDYMELKRFYVEPEYRRLGIASELLAYLESKAKELGYLRIRLETGAPQPEALHFYKRHGYVEIDKFGEYVHCHSSLCFEKHLPIQL